MIVRAGGLVLTAPGAVPVEARAPLDHVHQQARRGLGVADDVLSALERAAFGEEPAATLRSMGSVARGAALQQLLVGWGEIDVPWRGEIWCP